LVARRRKRNEERNEEQERAPTRRCGRAGYEDKAVQVTIPVVLGIIYYGVKGKNNRRSIRSDPHEDKDKNEEEWDTYFTYWIEEGGEVIGYDMYVGS
jgi:hypothetical protein